MIIVILISIIPLWLFVSWIVNLVQEAKSQKEEIVLAKTPQNYQFCESVDTEVELDKVKEGLVPDSLEITSVDINLPVISMPLVNGTWKVYDKVANYAEGTALINGEKGNVGIYGHDRDGAFSSIKNVSQDDQIFLFSGDYKAIYKVEETFISNPENVDVFKEADEPLLTLVTCDGIFSQQRFIVRAKLEKIEEINCGEQN